MAYSINELTNASQCDELTASVTAIKDDLNHDLTNNVFDLKAFSTTNSSVDDDLSITTVELNAQQSVFATLPAGDLKKRTDIRIKRLEARKAELEKRAGDYSEVALILKEFNKARLLAEIAEADSLLAAIAVQKAKF